MGRLREKGDQLPETTTEVDEGSNGSATEPLTPKQLARLLKTDARTVRKFLRNQYGKVGQGNRWGLDHDDLDKFTDAWREWRDKIDARTMNAGIAEIVHLAEQDSEEELEVE